MKGRPLGQRQGSSYPLRLPEQMDRELRRRAKREKRSLRAVLVELLEAALESESRELAS